MLITKEEALRIIVLVGYYLHHEGIVVKENSVAEGLGEVKLLRRIVEEYPELSSHVEMVFGGGSELEEKT